MSNDVPVVGGVLHNSGVFYLLVESEEADEGEYAIAVGQAVDHLIQLELRSNVEEIVSIIALPAEWVAQGEAACLTAEGMVSFLNLTELRSEVIPGTGYAREDSRGIGRMIALREADGWLFAMGFGGQVYRRSLDSGWEDISVCDALSAPPAFYTVAPGPTQGSFVFGGINVSEYEETDAIVAADEENDADRLADLILNAVDADTPAIRIYDHGWREVEFDVEGHVGPIFLEDSLSWLIFVSAGTIWRTRDFQSFDEVFATDKPLNAWEDVKRWNGLPLILKDDALHVLDATGLSDFRPPLPTMVPSYLSVSPSASGLAAIHREAVQLYDGTGWTSLTPVLG